METKDKNILLTKTEIEVLKLMAEGYKNSKIADIMYLSLHTIKSHTESIFRKTNSHNRIQAVLYGLKTGVLDLSLIKG